MENFNCQSVPFHYLHCLSPSCVRSTSCLRHLAMRHVPAEVTYIMAVDPANYPTGANRCTYFRSTEKQRYVWNISSLFDNIPYKKAVYLKRKVYGFYSRTTYYRTSHQERTLSPRGQEEIVALLPQTSIDEVPVLGRYTDEYNWDEQYTPKGNATP